jgi:hypothetical protein
MSVGCHEHDNGVVAGYLAELLERTAEHELLESRHSSDLAEDRLYAAGLLVANVLRREIAVRRPWRLDHNRRRGCSNRAQKRLQLDRQVLGNVLQLRAALAERLRPYCRGAELSRILTTEQRSCGVGWMDVTTRRCHADLGAICPSDQVSIRLQPPGLGAHLSQ